MAELADQTREEKWYESHRILYELAYREYEQATFELPGRLRDKVYSLLQLYVVTIGALFPLLNSILGDSRSCHSPALSYAAGGIGASLLVLALYYIRNGIQLRSYEIMDSTSIREVASEKYIDPLELVMALEKQLSFVRKKNADWVEELSLDIRRSYRLYFISLVFLTVSYLNTIL
jgi:hypothetical protein